MSNNWYEAVINKFGTVENFLDCICEKQGLTEEVFECSPKESEPCLTIDALIEALESVRESVGGDALVQYDDSSGYPYDATEIVVDGAFVVIR